MKKFTFMVLAVSVFFTGLGGLVDRAGAKFKSDERALAIIAQARQAIGGEAAIKNVRSLTINGNAEQTFTINGASRVEQGNLEINLQMPNKFGKMMKFGTAGGNGEVGNAVRENVKVVVLDKSGESLNLNGNDADGAQKKIVIMKKHDGDAAELPADGANVQLNRIVVDKNFRTDAGGFQQNELLRTTFALLLSAPEGSNASYNYGGVESVDGNSCDVIQVANDGSGFELFIDQSSHLPVMMSYQAPIPVVFNYSKDETATDKGGKTKNFIINKDGSQSELKDDRAQIISRRLDASGARAEYQVKFSDFRDAGGVQLPYKWTQTVSGQPNQTINITNYEINPANIADKFKNDRIILKTGKPM